MIWAAFSQNGILLPTNNKKKVQISELYKALVITYTSIFMQQIYFSTRQFIYPLRNLIKEFFKKEEIRDLR